MKAETLRYSDCACKQHGDSIGLADVMAYVYQQTDCLQAEKTVVAHIAGIVEAIYAVLIA